MPLHRVDAKDSVLSFAKAALSCLALSWQTTPVYTALRATVQVAVSVISIASIYCTKLLLDLLGNALLPSAQRWPSTLLLIVVLGLMHIARMVFDKLGTYASSMQQDKLRGAMDAEVMQHMMDADMQFFDSPSYQDLLQAWYRDAYAVNNMIWNLFSLGGALVTVAAAWGLLIESNFLFALIISASIIPAAISDRKYTKALYYWGIDHMEDERKIGYIKSLASDRRQAGEVRLYSLKNVLLEKYQNIWKRYFTQKKETSKQKTALAILLYLLPEVCASTIIAILAWRILSGVGGVGDYVLYSGLLWQLIAGLQIMVHSVMSVYEDKLRVDIIKRFRSIKNDVRNEGTAELKAIDSIKFENVCFRYPYAEEDTLHSLTFSIQGREKICLVGINGSGKSTIIKLLLRLYDVSSGAILINGQDIRAYELQSLRKGFSTYFQDYQNYAFSVRENVTLSQPDTPPTDLQIMQALHQAGSVAWLDASHNSLDSYVTKRFDEQGIELSGGQHQQLALARAIFRPCKMIVFDEPTGALDPESERRFFENVQKLWLGKTALFTSHRLSAAHLADRIILLDGGRIAEEGTHSELMRLKGNYYRLYQMQAEKYITGIRGEAG